jgi:hypothetical protein
MHITVPGLLLLVAAALVVGVAVWLYLSERSYKREMQGYIYELAQALRDLQKGGLM